MFIALRSTLTFKRLLGHSKLHKRGRDPMFYLLVQTDEQAQRKITCYKIRIKSIFGQFRLLESGRFHVVTTAKQLKRTGSTSEAECK